MAINNVVSPPLMTDGNPLSAFGVNQLVEATNFYGQQVYGNNVAWQRFTFYGRLDAAENRYIFVHKYDTLYINIYHTTAFSPLQIYARKAGAGQTLYLIYEATATPSGSLTTVTIDLSTNPGGFSVNPGDIYFVHLECENNADSTMSIIQYVHEMEASYYTSPSISTLTASTVIDDTYLNSIITPVRSLKALDVSSSYPFVGIRTNQYQTQSNTYMRWRLNHRNRYLHIGARMINEGILRIYLDDQLIETETKATATTEDFVYLYDMTTIATDLSITAPSIGDDYEIKFRYSDNGAGSPFIIANFVWELPTP